MTEPIHTGSSEVSKGPSQRRRVLSVLPAGILAGVLVGLVGPWQLAVLSAWAVTAGAFVVRCWLRLSRFDEAETRAFATRALLR
jgi:uncharacterized membrane protein YjjP (DUF1212 family)